MDDQVTALLRRAADVGGDFVPPDIAGLATRGRRRRLSRTALAVASVVILVAGLAVGLHFAGNGSKSPVAQPSSNQAGPSLAALEHGEWSSLPRAPIATRYPAATAWTGSQLLIWGGVRYGHGSHIQEFADGAAYTPASRSWQILSKAPLSPRSGGTFAWTGSVLFVWGGGFAHGHRTDGATYDPTTHRWRLLPAAPITDYGQSAAVSVNGKVVLITSRPGDSAAIRADEFDPASNRWTALPDLALTAGHDLTELAALAAGARVFVWSLWSRNPLVGQGVNGGSGTDGYALDPRTRAWTAIPIRADVGSDVGTPIWTGSRVLLLGEENRSCSSCHGPPTVTFRGVSIDPASGARTAIATRGFGVKYPDYVWTGSYVIGFNESYQAPKLLRGATAAWDPRRNSWTDLPQAPSHPGNNTTVWTGHNLLAWTADGALLEFTPGR